jgi:hypothetical protein
MDDGFAKTTRGEKAKTPSKFDNYFTYEERVRDLLKPENSHRYLAMRRGWMEEELVLHLGGPSPRESAEAKPRRRRDRWPGRLDLIESFVAHQNRIGVPRPLDKSIY